MNDKKTGDDKSMRRSVFVRMMSAFAVVLACASMAWAAALKTDAIAKAPQAPDSDKTDLASGVHAAEKVDTFTDKDFTIKAGAALTPASFDVTEDGVALDLAVAKSIIASDGSLIVPSRGETLCDARVLPTLSADVKIGETVVVGIELGGAQLLVTSAENVKVAKIRADGSAKLLERVGSKAELADGKYTIYDVEKKEYASDIELSKNYILNVAIRDGGENDIDGAANGSVLDPLTTFRVRKDGVGEGSSSSGSCDTGFGLVAVAGLAALVLRRRGR